MDKLVIKKLEVINDDALSSIKSLFAQLYPDLKKPVDSKLLEKIIRSQNEEIYIAQLDGKIIGMGGLVYYDKIPGLVAIIEDVVVDSSLRGKGIGRLLVQTLVNRVKELGADFVDLDTRMKDARDFYLKLGFEEKNANRPFFAMRYYVNRQ